MINLQKLTDEAFAISLAKGYNQIEDIERTMMLIIADIGNAVEHDRVGHDTAKEASLANVVIRIATLMGAVADTLDCKDDEQMRSARRTAQWMYEHVSFPAMCLHLCDGVSRAHSQMQIDRVRWQNCLKQDAWQVIQYCDITRIDLESRINEILEFQKSNPRNPKTRY